MIKRKIVRFSFYQLSVGMGGCKNLKSSDNLTLSLLTVKIAGKSPDQIPAVPESYKAHGKVVACLSPLDKLALMALLADNTHCCSNWLKEWKNRKKPRKIVTHVDSLTWSQNSWKGKKSSVHRSSIGPSWKGVVFLYQNENRTKPWHSHLHSSVMFQSCAHRKAAGITGVTVNDKVIT